MAQPSRSNRAGWEPLDACYVCGERIYMENPKGKQGHEVPYARRARGAMFSWNDGKPRSRHGDCLPCLGCGKSDGRTMVAALYCHDCCEERQAA